MNEKRDINSNRNQRIYVKRTKNERLIEIEKKDLYKTNEKRDINRNRNKGIT